MIALNSNPKQTGYGTFSHGLERELRGRGIGIDPRAEASLLVSPTFGLKTFFAGQRLYCWTMWETTRLPEIVLERIDNFETIFVPHEDNVEQFSEHHPDVKLLMPGLDYDFWTGTPAKDKPFTFLLIGPRRGGNDLRKGTDLALKAHQLAFPEGGTNLNVVHTQGRLSPETLRQTYLDSHVYIAPSRGEGWNLLPFQALALGRPVIVSDCPGHSQWAKTLPGAYLCPTSLTSSPIGGIAGTWAGDWWDCDLKALAELMRFVYENYDEAQSDALLGAEAMRANLTWPRTANELLAHVPLGGLVEGVEVEAKKRPFTAIAARSGKAHIGPDRYTFTKGEPVDLTADALRTLRGSGAVIDEPVPA